MVVPRPRVEGSLLRLASGSTPPITVGEPEWFAWLQTHRTFDYADGAAAFVALKERTERAGVYWRAVRHANDATHSTYLGPSRDLTLKRLKAAARTLMDEGIVPADLADSRLIRARSFAPPLRRGHVARERLLIRLRDDVPLTLVIAPAGYGKTTLLAQWIAADARQVAWVSLEPTHDESHRFWASVLDALDGIVPGVTGRARALLSSAGMALLTPLLHDVEAGITANERGASALLVLDDYHLITDRGVHEAVATLIERLPTCLRLVISGRESPALPVARLRARGQLVEVRAHDLAFNEAETARFLRETMGLAVETEAATALADRTEGWATGLQIAALGLRERADQAAFIAAFRGDHRHVAGYLVDEVIDRQPQEIRQFLLRTAVLDRLCAPLCDAVLRVDDAPAIAGPTSSQATLERLEAAGLFLAPLDDEGIWYRYHHLFAEVLLHRLRAEAPRLETALRQRAAAWYETAGSQPEAVEQALAAADWARAARIIEEVADVRWQQGDFTTLERWIAALPADLMRSRPRLLLARAAIAYASRDYRRLPQLVDELKASLGQNSEPGSGRDANDPVLRARTLVLQAMAASIRGDSARARSLATEALAALPADDATWRAFVQLQSNYLAYFADDLDAAGRYAAEGLALAQISRNPLLVVVMLLQQAHLLVDRGSLTAAELHLARARGVVERLGAWALPEAAALDHVAALVHYERNELAESEHLEASARVIPAGEGRSLLRFWGSLILARIRAARGNTMAAHEALDEAERLYRAVRPTHGPRMVWTAQVVPAWRARLAAAVGDIGLVRAWADGVRRIDLSEAPLAYWAHGPIPSMQARARLLSGDATGALEDLVGLRARAEAGRAGRVLLELLGLEAQALDALGRRDAAAAAVRRMIELAEPERAVRPFLDEGAPMADLLRRVAGRGGAGGAYARSLLAAFDPDVLPSAQPSRVQPLADLVEHLTERERAVLGLTADGLSNEEIAGQLYLSVGTVKWHLRSIYGKLGAERRTDAVAKARAAGLLV